MFSDADFPASDATVYGLLGLLCGAGIAVSGWSADLLVRGLAPSVDHLVLLHATNPLHWLLDLASPALAAFGWALGRDRPDGAAAHAPSAPAFDLAAHVLSYTAEPMLVLDAVGNIVTATPAMQRQFGWQTSTLTGQAADIVLCGYFEGGTAPRPARDPSGAVVALEWLGEAQRPDGTRVPVIARSLPGAAPESLRVVSVTDATEQAGRVRELEQLRQEVARLRLQANASQETGGGAGLEFFAKQVHELRNPLAVITALSAFVLEQLEQRGMSDLLQDMKDMVTASDRLRALVDRTLDLSKIEAGRMSVLLEPVAIEPLLEEVVQQHRVVAAERRNALVLDVVGDVGGVFADPMRLNQVLGNLLSNACKFTKDGRITLQVERRDSPDDPLGPRVLFHVTDTGIGMNNEQISRVFHEFEQATSQTKHNYGGTGLGLALVMRFAKMMNGDVRVQSAVGAGTRFTLELPAVLSGAMESDSAA